MQKKRAFSLSIGKLPDQVVRIVVIFGLALAGMIVARERFIPDTFGDLGHYRAAAVPLNADLPIHYVGSHICNDCHEDQVAAAAASYHRLLSCEVCHGPSYEHAEIDFDEHEAHIPNPREDCLVCHHYLSARPTGFPQIIEMEHSPADACIKCHDPHDPTPPEPEPGKTRAGCSGCHGEIARTKSVSYHRIVPCETCHETPVEHATSPRLDLAHKPQRREFCGKCHEEGAQVLLTLTDAGIREKDVPRVDFATHGEHYVCWQCHYPHFPEAD